MPYAGTDSYVRGMLDGCFAALGYPGTIGVLLDLVAVTIAVQSPSATSPAPRSQSCDLSSGSWDVLCFGEALLSAYQAFAARGAWLSKIRYGAAC